METQEEHDDLDGVPSPAATFALTGHGAQWRELVEAHASGRLHHAWLLQGPRGIGKATAAFAFARHLLSGGDVSASNAPALSEDHPVVRQIAQGSHPNLVHVTRPRAERGTGFRTAITVEEIRRLIHFFHATTSAKQWRIAIVDPADDMNRSAANALLKILEEPPERSIFLLTSHRPGRLLPTIRSRCRVLRFDSLPEAEIVSVLAGLPLSLEPNDIAIAARQADGSVRKALSLLLNGGLEIGAKLNQILAEDRPDWTSIHGLADALTQRGRETAFDLLLERLFEAIARESRDRLRQGDGDGAAMLSLLWQEESLRIRDALAYNLDRKQMLLTLFAKLFEVRAELAFARQ